MAGAFRFLRVALADRPARAGRPDPAAALRPPGAPHGRAAQSQHRLVRAVAGPESRIERPPSAGRAAQRARACPSKRRGAARPRAGRPALASACWATSKAGSSACPTRLSRMRRPKQPGREIPVEAVVERLIQMTPERLVDRMGPASVKAARPLSPAARPAAVPAAAGHSQPGRLPRKKPGRSRGAGRQLSGPPDSARARRRLLLRRSARHAFAAGLSRPPGCHDRQRHAHARQATALAGLGVLLSVRDRQRSAVSRSRFSGSSTRSRP